jgi:hypothetical protein
MPSSKDEKIFESIDDSIKELVNTFEKYPDIFLTEEDLRCFLYSNLLNKKSMQKLHKTSDNSYSIPIHTEIRWYGNDYEELKYRSDIVIIDPKDLQTKNNEFFNVNSKGFSFNNYYAVIELKLRRINGDSDNSFLNGNSRRKNGINNDLEKLKKIREKVSQSIYKTRFYSINFDKKLINDLESKIVNFRNINFYYISVNGDNKVLFNNWFLI